MTYQAKEWDERCVLGHCGSPSGCERDGACRADFPANQSEDVSLKTAQDPVAYLCCGSLFHSYAAIPAAMLPPNGHPVPLFAALPPQAKAEPAGVSEREAFTDDELADLIPQTAGVLEIEGERKKVCMTRAELHQFIRAILSAAPSTGGRQQ